MKTIVFGANPCTLCLPFENKTKKKSWWIFGRLTPKCGGKALVQSSLEQQLELCRTSPASSRTGPYYVAPKAVLPSDNVRMKQGAPEKRLNLFSKTTYSGG